MSTGEERLAWLSAAAAARGGRVPPEADLELWALLDVRNRQIAEYVLWDDRDAVLDSFAELLPALDGPPGEPAAPAWSPVDLSPHAQFDRLRQWRDGVPEAAHLADADLARIVTARPESAADVELASQRLTSGEVIREHSAEVIGALLGVEPTSATEATPPSVEEQAPEPDAAPAPSAPPPAAPEQDHFPEFAWEPTPVFAPYDWAQGAAEAYGQLVVAQEGERLRFAWTPASGGAAVALYRIVESGTTWPSGAPEVGGLVGVTRSTSGTLSKRASGAVTYFAVWVNEGGSVLEATQAQPRLVGVAQVVWPPSQISLQVTAQRTVAAVLTAPEGSRVEVQRFEQGAPIAYDSVRELAPGSVTATGFHDRRPPVGKDLVYAVFCVAELSDGSHRVSAPVTAEARIIAEPQQVALDVKPSAKPGEFDILWEPPADGEVLLYATQHKLENGLDAEPRSREILEGQGLTADSRIAYPPEDLGGLRLIRGFAVDPSWVRTHFVAVHRVSEEAMWVGPSVAIVSPRAPRFGQVVERVDSQVITFEWPKSVTIVQAYQGPRGGQLDPAAAQPIASLTEEEYRRRGGMRITRALPSNGCAVQLHGVVYLDGTPSYSEPVILDYPGMTRLWYKIVPLGADRNPARPGEPTVAYRVYARVDEDLHQTPLCLVAAPGLLPLHPDSGRIVAQPVASLAANQPTPLCELPAGANPVYLRLFVDLPPDRVGQIAVLDPAIETMRVML